MVKLTASTDAVIIFTSVVQTFHVCLPSACRFAAHLSTRFRISVIQTFHVWLPSACRFAAHLSTRFRTSVIQTFHVWLPSACRQAALPIPLSPTLPDCAADRRRSHGARLCGRQAV